MIKIRLHGTSEEITKFADFLEGLLDVQVFTRSESYPDRGKSVYERVYMDVELEKCRVKVYELNTINELIENLYFSTDDRQDKLEVFSQSKFARAYFIAKQLHEFDAVDFDEVEDNVNKVCENKAVSVKKV